MGYTPNQPLEGGDTLPVPWRDASSLERSLPQAMASRDRSCSSTRDIG